MSPTKKSRSPVTVQKIQERLQTLGDPQKAQILQRFFKTGPGEYGQGDVFVGLRVPDIRKLAKEYSSLPLPATLRLLRSPIHEARLLALLILVQAARCADSALQKQICDLYLQNTRFINNWDLVDLSAYHIVGPQLKSGSGHRPAGLAASRLIWDRRIAIMATFHLIKKGEFSLTLTTARRLLKDPEDLIHKAVGWMLREVGKRDQKTEESFLKDHYRIMPRTMLRYAIERFPEGLRQRYLKGEIA
ncbi:MAG: DNA alkylation repair protein [Pseudomonadota bacterium]